MEAEEIKKREITHAAMEEFISNFSKTFPSVDPNFPPPGTLSSPEFTTGKSSDKKLRLTPEKTFPGNLEFD